jgi:hypothetical protein
MFIVINQEEFDTNLILHSNSTRNKRHIRRSTAITFLFTDKSVQCCHLMFSMVLCRPTSRVNGKARFEAARRMYLNSSFYTVDEFLMLKNDL